MKTIFLILIVGLVLTLNSNSQYPCNLNNQDPCPQGTTGPYCFTMEYFVPNTNQVCSLAVYYCIIITNNNGLYPVTASLRGISPQYISCLEFLGNENQDFQDKMWTAILNDIYNNYPSIFPPCGVPGPTIYNGYLVFERSSRNCLKLVNDPVIGLDIVVPCANSEYLCTDYYFVCYNSITGLVERHYDHSEPFRSPDCPAWNWNLWQPPPGKTWQDYFETPYCYWDCLQH